jgi:hypothetical protein
MRYYTIVLTLFLFISCSTPDKENKTQTRDSSNLVKPVTTAVSPVDTNWVTYIDTINTGFVVSFKYSRHLFAEHFENAECIGKKIKLVDDGPMTTMDCSMWMDDISEGNVRPIDTLIQYGLQTLKVNAEVLKDTIVIANVKGTRARFYDRNDREKVLRQSVYFTKYDTFFELDNDSLRSSDFEMFVKSLKIEKDPA